MQKQQGRQGAAQVGKERTAKVITLLNRISQRRHNGAAVFAFAAGEESLERVTAADNTIEKREHGGGVGIAVKCTYNNMKKIIHVRCAYDKKHLAGATLTTESNRSSKWGLLKDSYIMAVIISTINDEPLSYGLYRFNELAKNPKCIEPRADRDTFIRVHLDRLVGAIVPIIGLKKPNRLIYNHLEMDAVEAIMKFMEEDNVKIS